MLCSKLQSDWLRLLSEDGTQKYSEKKKSFERAQIVVDYNTRLNNCLLLQAKAKAKAIIFAIWMLNLILVIITNSILFPLKLSRYLDAEPHASCEFFYFLSLFPFRSPWPAVLLDFFSFPLPSVPSGLQPSSSSFFYFFLFFWFFTSIYILPCVIPGLQPSIFFFLV